MSDQKILCANKTWTFYRFRFLASKLSLSLLVVFFIGIRNTNAQNSDFEFALANIGVSSIIGGVGAVINKQPEQKFGKVFIKGLAQGALGGYVVFESKRMLRSFAKTENYAYVWPSKIVNAAGNSIIENAASNQNFWEQWHLNIGFNRFDIYTKDKFRLQYRILPFSLGTSIYSLVNYSFDASESLKLGTLMFKDKIIEINGNTNINAAARDNLIFIKPSTKIQSKAHELVHTYQYEQLSGFNNYLDQPSKRLKKNSKLYNFYTKYFYTDWNSLISQLPYVINPRFEENIFELESEYFEK